MQKKKRETHTKRNNNNTNKKNPHGSESFFMFARVLYGVWMDYKQSNAFRWQRLNVYFGNFFVLNINGTNNAMNKNETSSANDFYVSMQIKHRQWHPKENN